MARRLGRSQAALALAVLLSAPAAALVVHGRGGPEPRVAAGPGEIEGIAEVTDGDTLRIGTERIRLFAIDAPEAAQTCGDGAGAWACGRIATERLQSLASGRTVTCAPRDRDRYGRLVSTCRAAGTDLGRLMVAEGLARAYLRYGDAYEAAEAGARAAGLGLWRAPSQAPWDYRQARAGTPRTTPVANTAPAAAAPPEAPPSPACRIKGNVSASGARLYHLPGGPSYARTRIDPRRGEAWFCDEAAASAAGFRPARTR